MQSPLIEKNYETYMAVTCEIADGVSLCFDMYAKMLVYMSI